MLGPILVRKESRGPRSTDSSSSDWENKVKKRYGSRFKRDGIKEEEEE